MIRTVADVLRDRAKAEGIAEGIAEGKAEGKAEGRVDGKGDTLMRLLKRVFSYVPDAVEPIVRKANEDQLDCWLDRVVGARKLDDVFVETHA